MSGPLSLYRLVVDVFTMITTKKAVFALLLLDLISINTGKTIQHRTDINILSKSAIKVIGDVDDESFLTFISVTTANSRQSVRQHADIINIIAGGVANGMSIISLDDGNCTPIRRFEQQKRFNILVVDGLNGFR